MQKKYIITNPNPIRTKLQTVFFLTPDDLDHLQQLGKNPIGASEGYHIPVIFELWQACQPDAKHPLATATSEQQIRYAIDLIEHIGKGQLAEHFLHSTLLTSKQGNEKALPFLADALHPGLFNHLRSDKAQPDRNAVCAFLVQILGDKDVFVRNFDTIGHEFELKFTLISLLLGINNFIFEPEARGAYDVFRSAQLYLSGHKAGPTSDEFSAVLEKFPKLQYTLGRALVHRANYWESPEKFLDELRKAHAEAKQAYDNLVAKHPDTKAPLKHMADLSDQIEQKFKILEQPFVLETEIKSILQQLQSTRNEVAKDLHRRATLVHDGIIPTYIAGAKQPYFNRLLELALPELSTNTHTKIHLSAFALRLLTSVIYQGDWRQALTGRFPLIGLEEKLNSTGKLSESQIAAFMSGTKDPQIHFVRSATGRIEWIIAHTPVTNPDKPDDIPYFGVYVAIQIPTELDEQGEPRPPGAYPKLPIYYGMYAQPEYAKPFQPLAHALVPDRYPAPVAAKTDASSQPSFLARHRVPIFGMAGLGAILSAGIFLALYFFIPALATSAIFPPLGMAVALVGVTLCVAVAGALLFGALTSLALKLIGPTRKVDIPTAETNELQEWLTAICLELSRPEAYRTEPQPAPSLSPTASSGLPNPSAGSELSSAATILQGLEPHSPEDSPPPSTRSTGSDGSPPHGADSDVEDTAAIQGEAGFEALFAQEVSTAGKVLPSVPARTDILGLA